MRTEEELHEELLSLYRRTGEATGDYWPNYFRRAVRNRGGLAVAKQLLAPGQVSSGFDRLIEARRADLSVEAVATSDDFAHLFTAEELAEAQRRLAALPPEAFPLSLTSFQSTPGEVAPGESYTEGGVERVLVNRYERNQAARSACIRHHGARCAACGLSFEERYGEIGCGFMHVHHKRPLRTLPKSYKVDPKKDLVPVCPNCHAMLHKQEPPFDVEQLRAMIRK